MQVRGQSLIILGTGTVRIGKGMKAFPRTIGGYETLWVEDF